jgi:fatty aldehyde decarbonylase
MNPTQNPLEIDYYSPAYQDTYSRVNGIVIEGEQHAHDNFMRLAEMIPEDAAELTKLGKMEWRHRKSFEACGRNLGVEPDLAFARQFFADLASQFQTAANAHQIAACLVIQALVIECFAIAAYNSYAPVADDYARPITEAVMKDEFSHLNYGELWLKTHFKDVKPEIEATNRQVLPIIWRMLNEVAADVKVLGMNKQTLITDFITRYGETLAEIGFTTREILRLSTQGLTAA